MEPIAFFAFDEDRLSAVINDAVTKALNAHTSIKKSIEVPPIFDISTCEKVTGLKKSTIYRNTSKKRMPHYLRDGKLYFRRDEIYAWLTENRIQTCEEFKEEKDEQLTKKRKKYGKSCTHS